MLIPDDPARKCRKCGSDVACPCPEDIDNDTIDAFLICEWSEMPCEKCLADTKVEYGEADDDGHREPQNVCLRCGVTSLFDPLEWAKRIIEQLRRENAEYRARMEDLRVIGVFMAGDTPPFISAVFGQISGHYFDAIEAELKNQDVKVEGDALVYVEYKVESDREEFWLKELSRQVEDAPIKTPEDL